jgi:hypothetical protein
MSFPDYVPLPWPRPGQPAGTRSVRLGVRCGRLATASALGVRIRPGTRRVVAGNLGLWAGWFRRSTPQRSSCSQQGLKCAGEQPGWEAWLISFIMRGRRFPCRLKTTVPSP